MVLRGARVLGKSFFEMGHLQLWRMTNPFPQGNLDSYAFTAGWKNKWHSEGVAHV